jgi:phosphoglycolate phosphatase-like HAD superfamily hydrolase
VLWTEKGALDTLKFMKRMMVDEGIAVYKGTTAGQRGKRRIKPADNGYDTTHDMKYTDIVWDFDGTLFNSYPFMRDCFKKALGDFGITDSDKAVMEHITVTLYKAALYYHENCGAPEPGVLLNRYTEYENSPNTEAVRPFPGIVEILQYITSEGGRNHLLTLRNRLSLYYLEYFGIEKYFSEKITREDDYPRKPDPGALIHIIKKYNIKAVQLLMIGDRSLDIEAGKNAGAVSCFFNTNDLEIPAVTDFTITDILCLKSFI